MKTLPSTTSSPTITSKPAAISSSSVLEYCKNYADPHQDVDYCTCSSTSSGSVLYTSLPLTNDLCNYVAFPTPTNSFPFTETVSDTVIAYATSTVSVQYAGGTSITQTHGAGATTVVQAPSPTVLFPFTETISDTVIAYATSTESVQYVAGMSITHTYGAGSSTTVSVPSPTAECATWNEVLAIMVLIYDIDHWDISEDDLESHLKSEEKGCGAITGWDFSNSTSRGTAAKFNLPTIFKAGCVERAIHSAGGPNAGDISCDGQGDNFFDGSDSVQYIVDLL